MSGIEVKNLAVEVGSLAVLRAEFPIVTTTVENVDIRLATIGSGGARVRTWISRPYENSTSTTETVGLLALGVIKVGGGIQVRFGPATTQGPASPLPVVVDLTNDPTVQNAIKRSGGTVNR